ncbi:reverse transcriptase domain, reverse transcriptase zinc-binding domain protein [Tanacetum coccineum]
MPNVLDRRDLLEWRNELGLVKPFSVSMVWSCIRPRGDKVSWFDVVWFSYCIPRHAVNLWLIMKQRLKTQDKLSSWDVSGSLMTSCPLCDLQPDSLEHLFFECTFSMQIWSHMSRYAGMNSVGPVFTQIVSAIMPFAKRKSSRSVIAKLVLAACAYFVWQERNERLFKNSTRSVKQVIDCIMTSVRLKLLTCQFRRTKDGEFFAALWSLPDAIFI